VNNYRWRSGRAKKGVPKNKSSGKEPDECFAKIEYYFLIAKKKQIILLIFEVIRFNLWFKRSRLRKKSKL
jgi:hypothetical protein